MTKEVEVVNVTCKETEKIPELYIMFPDNLDAAVERLSQIEEKLYNRGYRVVKPLVAYRIQYFPDSETPHYSLVFELTKVSEEGKA